jgi:hypothetical protein
MIDFAHDAAKFWYYYLMTASTLLMMTSFGLFLVSATSMVELAQMLSGAINFLFNQFNGEDSLSRLQTVTCVARPHCWCLARPAHCRNVSSTLRICRAVMCISCSVCHLSLCPARLVITYNFILIFRLCYA